MTRKAAAGLALALAMVGAGLVVLRWWAEEREGPWGAWGGVVRWLNGVVPVPTVAGSLGGTAGAAAGKAAGTAVGSIFGQYLAGSVEDP